MLKANTGSSINSDAREAGREAAQKAERGLDQIKMAFVYASNNYDLAELLAGVRSVWPDTPLTGGTSCRGVLLPEGYITGRHFVGALALSDPELTVTTGQAQYTGDPIEAGRQAALAALTKTGASAPPDYYHLTALPGFEEYYLKGITQIIGRQPMSGLCVADNEVMGDWGMFTEEGLVGYGLGVAFFRTNRPPVVHLSSAGYTESNELTVVTKMKNPRTLVELGYEPVLKHMVERSGFDPLFLNGTDLRVITAASPIGVKDCPDNLTIIRYPMLTLSDDSIAMGTSLSVGTGVIRMYSTADGLVAAGHQVLEELKAQMKTPAGAFHLAYSFGRGMLINDEGRGAEARDKIRQAAGDVPFIMPFTLTEMGFEADGPNTCGNLMLSYTGFPQ